MDENDTCERQRDETRLNTESGPGERQPLSRSRLREKPGKLLLLRRRAEIERTTLKMLIGWNVVADGDARENDRVFPSPVPVESKCIG